ncbi:MAG: CaiB/BaiF CoA-transferase family protein [Acidimicrobiales bacterium]
MLAGPWCAQLLGDLGADVIKVERPGLGDDTRHWGPPWLQGPDGEPTSESSYYLCANRGKRSVTVDIGSDAGRQIVLDLAAISDIVIENFKVGALAAKGLGFEDLKAVKPDIIYASITGFGQTGPRANQPGYDYLAQALGGLMSITGRADGEPGEGPMRAGIAVADLSTGMYTTVAILGALIHRMNTGEGQHIDTALLDTQTAMLANAASWHLVGGVPPIRTGTWHPNVAPYQPFEASDGQFIVAVGNDRQYRAFCELIGRPELATDERFVTNPDRNHNRAVLAAEIQIELVKATKAHWLEVLPAAGVPSASINDIGEVFAEPQVQHRGMRLDLTHGAGGTAPGVATPIKYSATPLEYSSAPPLLGEHTEQVLRDLLGRDESEVASLRDSGAI